MSQPISSLMHREVWSVGLDDTIQAVEAMMVAKGLSWAPVVDGSNGLVLGVISSFDLLRFHADDKQPSKVRAWQLCTYRPICVRPDTSVSEVARLMIDSKIHHVVVTDGNDIEGVVSSLDFVRAFVTER